MVKEAFNGKVSLLISKLNIELRYKLSGVIFEAFHCMVQRPGTKKILAEVFGKLQDFILEVNAEDKLVKEYN